MATRPKRVKKRTKRAKGIRKSHPAMNVLLIIAIVSGLLILVGQLFFPIFERFSVFYLLAEVFIISILFVDLVRTFMETQSMSFLLKHHWLDLTILVIIIVTFSSVLYAGSGRLFRIYRGSEGISRLGSRVFGFIARGV